MIPLAEELTWGLARTLGWLLEPVDSLDPLLGLFVASIGFAALIVLVYRFASPQRSIRRARERIGGDLLGLIVYSHSLTALAQSAVHLLRSTGRFLLVSSPPLFLLAPLFLLVWPALDARYGTRAFRAGEEGLVTARFRPGVSGDRARLLADSGDRVVAGPVPIEAGRGAVWRLRFGTHLVHRIEVEVPGTDSSTRIELRVHDRTRPLPQRQRVQGAGVVATLSCEYPRFHFWIGERELDWTVPGAVLLVISCWLLARVFGVRF